ncbi:MAG TPA: mycofactocin biosynthesis glycosyltransferase MftF [Candidatus Dormibacteraeota bacterium]|nr:mycofactocin biosynthesis glycosyltransferase MftF [Candidatus Dormibacteraeota bacterium]
MSVSGWRCRLVAGARLRTRQGRHFLVCGAPLAVLELRERGRRLLASLPPGEEVTIPEPPGPELRLLHRLAGLGLLDLRPAPARWPDVSIVVPVRDRAAELDTCLRSLRRVRYPGAPPRVVVVDDGSRRPVTAPAGVRVVRLDRPVGPGRARNAGAALCTTELLAFLDSDCRAEPGWLEALVPELGDPAVAAAGGRVLPERERSWLERYEAVRSPLDLGAIAAPVRPRRPVPYLVTANLVVRRAVFDAIGGFDPEMDPGEDVDLCWRLAAAGHRLVYRPEAAVRHAHRGALPDFITTRARYAGSEAVLLRRHPGNGRWLGFSPGLGALVAGGLGVLLGRPGLLAAGGLALGLEVAAAAGKLEGLGVPRRRAAAALLRGQAGSLYHAARQLTRYYGLGAALVALSWRPARMRLGPALAAAALAPAVADWYRLRPRLSLPAFLAAHLLDDAAYQYGLLRGCLRERSAAALGVEVRLAGGRPD